VMGPSMIWCFVRIIFLVLGLFAFSEFIHHDTNFDLMGGLVCGAARRLG
jgi:hypothetical protein